MLIEELCDRYGETRVNPFAGLARPQEIDANVAEEWALDMEFYAYKAGFIAGLKVLIDDVGRRYSERS